MHSIILGVLYLLQKNYIDAKDFHIICSLLAVVIQSSGRQTFSMKDQRVKCLGFVGHVVSVKTTLPHET